MFCKIYLSFKSSLLSYIGKILFLFIQKYFTCTDIMYLHILVCVCKLNALPGNHQTQYIQLSYLSSYFFVSVWTQKYLCYLGDYNTVLVSFMLLLSLSQHWPSGVPSSCPLCPFNMPPFDFLSTSLLFGSKMFRFILYFPCPSLESIPFPRSPVPFLGEWYLGAGCAQCYRMSILLDLISSQSQEIYYEI